MEIATTTKDLELPSATTEAKKLSRPLFDHFKLLGLYNHYTRPILNLFEESVDHIRDLHCYATVGRVTGADDKDILLPVATPCFILPQGVEFRESLPEKAWAAAVPCLLNGARKLWKIRSLGPSISTETHLNDDTTIRVTSKQNSENDTNVRVCRLGDVLLYVPKSIFHVRICLVARKLLAEDPNNIAKIASHIERSTSSWKFFPSVKQRKDFSWKLFQSESTQYPPAPVGILLDKWFDSQRSNSSRTFALRLELDQDDMISQMLRLCSGRKNGLQRATINLLASATDLALLIQRLWETEERDSSLPCLYHFPSFLGDIASQARRHYNLKRVTAAADSQIEALRKLNNEAKRFLINSYIPEHGSVLDLACGHGQDLQKYSGKNLKRFVGIDISEEEIKEALNRMQQGPPKLPGCCWSFHVGNLLEDAGYLPIEDELFDAISIQLAIHYFMESQATADALLSRISARLKPGGVLIGSTGCCETIADRVNSKLTYTPPSSEHKSMKIYRPYGFGNPVYRVEFTKEMLELATGSPLPSEPELSPEPSLQQPYQASLDAAVLHRRLQSVWGIRYFFHLIEHIDAEEYVVPWESFCEVASRHGLHFVQHQTFDKLIAQGAIQSPELRDWMRRVLVRIRFQEDQAEVFSFYKSFVFSKGEMKYLPKWMRTDGGTTELVESVCSIQDSTEISQERQILHDKDLQKETIAESDDCLSVTSESSDSSSDSLSSSSSSSSSASLSENLESIDEN